MAIPSVFTGGILPQCCPLIDPAGLLLPPDSALGAAAQVQKDTLEAAKRRAAIRYMSTADCNWWPEVQAALANSLRMDRNECVRLEAALALQRGCCCNPTTVRALVQALSPAPTDGNPPEDSPRVRAAAMVALDHCLCCYFAVAAAPPPPAPAVVPVPEQLPQPRKEGPPPEEVPPPPPPPPPPGAKPVVRAEPPLRPVSATAPTRDASMDQLIQEARRVLQKAKERQEAATRAAAAKPQSLTELLEETFSPSTTRAALDAGQQKPTPPPTIFGPPVRTTTVVVQPSPAPTASVATAPKENPPLAPVAANAAPSLTPPAPAAPTAPPTAPPSAATTPPASAAPSPRAVSASPVPLRPVSLAEAASGVKTPPETAPVVPPQTAATPASRQTLKTSQLLLLLRNSSHADVRAYAARSLGGSEEPTPALVQALIKSAGTDASSDVRLACLKTLLKLRVNDPALPSTLMRLQTDQDSRVRDAAKTLHEQLQSRADASPTPRS